MRLKVIRGWSPTIQAVVLAAVAALIVFALASASSLVTRHHPNPAALPSSCHERATLTAPDGQVSGCVSYRYGPRDQLHIRGVAAAFTAKAGFADPNFVFTFRNLKTGAVDYRFSGPIIEANAVRSHSTGLILRDHRPGLRAVPRGDVLEVTLQYENSTGLITPVATVSLSLNRGGLLCPDLGNDPQTFNGVPIC
jgi:hypothetical protein